MPQLNVTLESVKRAYQRQARFYNIVFGALFNPGRKSAIQHLHCQSGDRILEVGVGTGLSLGFYPRDIKVVGIDLSQAMLVQAQQRISKENMIQVESLLQMDAQQMAFPDNSFDKVAAMYVASVVPDAAKLVQEIKRVCKPNGTIIFLNHFQNRHPLVRRVEALLQPLASYIGFSPDFPLDEFLGKTGFDVITTIPVNFLDYWTILIGRNDKSMGQQDSARL